MSARILAVSALAGWTLFPGCGNGPVPTAASEIGCAAFVAEYAAAWPAALVCDPGAASSCDAVRPMPIHENGALAGLGCSHNVNPTRTAALDDILGRFYAQGCKVFPLPCPPPPPSLGVACPASGTCG